MGHETDVSRMSGEERDTIDGIHYYERLFA